jgi:putative aldouronate transport system permease protein
LNVIIIRTFFQAIPESIVESAKLDGAKEIRIFLEIIIPMSTPVLATIGLMALLARWNEWYVTLIYIRKPELYTLQYLLQKILRDAEFTKELAKSSMTGLDLEKLVTLPGENLKFAMCVLATGPMLFAFPFFQKYFAKGLTVGAVKG